MTAFAARIVHSEFTENIRATKGDAYAEMVSNMAWLLARSDAIGYTLETGEKSDQAKEYLVDIIKRVAMMEGQVRGIPSEQFQEVVDDTRVLMEMVNRHYESPLILP